MPTASPACWKTPPNSPAAAAIWAAELRYIADHPLLGSGFGTFTDTREPVAAAQLCQRQLGGCRQPRP